MSTRQEYCQLKHRCFLEAFGNLVQSKETKGNLKVTKPKMKTANMKTHQ